MFKVKVDFTNIKKAGVIYVRFYLFVKSVYKIINYQSLNCFDTWYIYKIFNVYTHHAHIYI